MDDRIKEFVEEIRKFENVKTVILFGSRARGDARPNSDYDIAIVLEKEDSDLESEIFSLRPKNADIVFFHRAPLYVKAKILKEGKILVNKDDRLLTRILYKTIGDYLDNQELYAEVY